MSTASTKISNVYPEGSVRMSIERKFSEIIHEELQLRSLVSYVGNKNIPFLRIYRCKEAFSFDLVREFLKRFRATPDDYVFDPFSGLGTTLFTSMIHGIPSVGTDLLPVAYFTSKTLPKFLFLRENEVKIVWESLKPKISSYKPADIALDVAIMKKAFDENTLLMLRKLKAAIDDLPDRYRDIFLLMFFSILEECSFTSKDGQFLRIIQDKKIENPIKAMGRKVAQVEEDIRRIKLFYPNLNLNKNILPEVYLADTRDLSGVPFKNDQLSS